MNRPPSPTKTSAMYSRRLEQNLTCLAPGVSGAVLLPVLSKVHCVNRWPYQVKKNDRLVKNVRNTRCTALFSAFFTLLIGQTEESKCRCEVATAESTGKLTTEAGRSDPTFSAFIRPKSFWGRSRPLLDPASFIYSTLLDGGKANSPLRTLKTLFGDGASDEFRNKACIAGPREGESQKCQS